MSIQEPAAQHHETGDGTRIAWHEVGEGRPLVLLHGYLSNGLDQWFRTGHAARLAAAGHRVILPDLRAHGASDAPHDPTLYLDEPLLDDVLELIEHLGLVDYDLGGYSLGGRLSTRMLALGAPVRRAAIVGIGLNETVNASGRGERYRGLLGEPPAPANAAEQRLLAHLDRSGADREALLLVLDSFHDTPVEAVAAIEVPTLVLVGDADERREEAQRLAATLPHGEFREITGDHNSAPRDWALGVAIAEFLD